MRKCVLILLLVGCAGATDEPADKPITLPDLMKQHFGAALDIRDAVINGDFTTLHASAARLARRREVADLPADWAPRLEALRVIADGLIETYDIKTAADGAANLARACGNCHTEADVRPVLPEYASPTLEKSTQAHMLRHAWAAARMWEGLMVPSEDRWVSGATMLAEEPLHGSEIVKGRALPAVFQVVAEKVHQLGRQAVVTSDRNDRVAVYAAFVSNCAYCHDAVRVSGG